MSDFFFPNRSVTWAYVRSSVHCVSKNPVDIAVILGWILGSTRSNSAFKTCGFQVRKTIGSRPFHRSKTAGRMSMGTLRSILAYLGSDIEITTEFRDSRILLAA